MSEPLSTDDLIEWFAENAAGFSLTKRSQDGAVLWVAERQWRPLAHRVTATGTTHRAALDALYRKLGGAVAPDAPGGGEEGRDGS